MPSTHSMLFEPEQECFQLIAENLRRSEFQDIVVGFVFNASYERVTPPCVVRRIRRTPTIGHC